MGTLNSKNLTQALSQARNIGLVEEPFVVGGTQLVVRNLRPDHYDSIFKECQGLSEVEYLNAWQMGHISRAICEINGVDLRDVTSIEDEEADPKRNGQTKTVRVETHLWLRRNVLSTWSREMIYITYRKVADAIEAGERMASQGVTFRVPDETAEDKYRRLVVELSETAGEVPDRMLDSILKEYGLMRRSTQDEIEAADAKLQTLKDEPAVEPPAVEPTPPPVVSAPVAPAPVQNPPPQAANSGPPSPERMAELLRNRVPMNQQPPEVGVPQGPPQAVSQPPPPQVVAGQVTPQPVYATPQSALSGRSAEMAALEGQFGQSDFPVAPVNLQPQGAVPEVTIGSSARLDPAAAQRIIDTPPQGGINPRFRPPTT